MHHLIVESHLFQILLVVRKFHMGYMCTFVDLWIDRRSNGTSSGGAYNALLALW